MRDVLQAVLNGAGQGAIYALLALGFVIVYRATKVVSFAQPALMVIGGLFTYHFTREWRMSFWLGLVLATVFTAALAALVERIALRPVTGSPMFTLAVITIGLDIVLRVFAGRYIGIEPKSVAYPGGSDNLELFGLSLSQHRVGAVLVTAVLVVVLAVFLQRSRLGLAMRATAMDQETALMQGVRVGVVFAVAWAIAGGLAAIAGTFVAASGAGLEATSYVIALKALPAIIIGGLDSLSGAVVGGLLVGVVESLTAVYQPVHVGWLGANFALVVPYALMLLVLLVRPYGLFGSTDVERV